MNEMNHTYQTGRTDPPKSRQGLIAGLLILVSSILCAFSAMSLMNIRFFPVVPEQEGDSVQFSSISAMTVEEPESLEITFLGFTGQEFTALYRSYQAWPQGIYITKITPDSPAASAGMQIGDIVTDIDENSVSNRDAFEIAIANLNPGETVEITLFRDGEKLQFTVDSEP